MQLVFFGNELNQRAPDLVGVFYEPQRGIWANLQEVIDVMSAGHAVSIRPASQEEMQRAEKRIALLDLVQYLAKVTDDVVAADSAMRGTDADALKMRGLVEESMAGWVLPTFMGQEG